MTSSLKKTTVVTNMERKLLGLCPNRWGDFYKDASFRASTRILSNQSWMLSRPSCAASFVCFALTPCHISTWLFSSSNTNTNIILYLYGVLRRIIFLWRADMEYYYLVKIFWKYCHISIWLSSFLQISILRELPSQWKVGNITPILLCYIPLFSWYRNRW